MTTDASEVPGCSCPNYGGYGSEIGLSESLIVFS